MSLITFISGMSVSFSLILAIGAQNAFVLKQGLKQEFVFIVCLICAVSDAILIAIGVFGLGNMITQHQMIATLAKYAGAIFLFYYGFKNFISRQIQLPRATHRKSDFTSRGVLKPSTFLGLLFK